MKRPGEALILLMLGTLLCGCAHSAVTNSPVDENDVKIMLAAENIRQVHQVEQCPQDDGSVVLLVTSNLRRTGFQGCVADRADIEVVRSSGGWVVNSMSDGVKLSLSPCRTSGEMRFVEFSGKYSDPEISQSVMYFRQLVAGSIPARLISGSQELKNVLPELKVDDLISMSFRNGDTEFQVLSRQIAPRLLGIQFRAEKGRLTQVGLTDSNAVEVALPGHE